MPFPQEKSRSYRENQEVLGGPGQGTVRVPFVDLFVGDTRLALQGLQNANARPEEGFSQRPEQSPFMLLDFNYRLRSSVGVGNEVTITILDPTWDVLEEHLARSLVSQSEISFQFGWMGLDDKFGRTVNGMLLHDYTVTYESPFQGAKVTLIGVDKNIKLSEKRRTKSFPTNWSISRVITEIYKDIDPKVKVVFEPGFVGPLQQGQEALFDPLQQKVGEEFRWFNNLSPLEYIRELLKIAKSATGSSNYIMVTDLDDQGTTIVRIIADNPGTTVVRQYFVGREREGQMIEFSPQVLGSVLLSLGGGRADGISVNTETGSAQKVTSTQDEVGANLANKHVNKTPLSPSGIHELPYSDRKAVGGYTSQYRSRADDYMNNATAVVLGDPNLRPFDQIDVYVLKSNVPGVINEVSDNALVHTSGTYRLSSVDHIISAGTFRTSLEMYRESSNIGNSDFLARIPTSLRTGITEELTIRPSIIDPVNG